MARSSARREPQPDRVIDPLPAPRPPPSRWTGRHRSGGRRREGTRARCARSGTSARIRRATAFPRPAGGGRLVAAARGAGRTGRATAAPTGRARRRAPGAPDDALTAPVGPALRGGVLAELDRAASERPTRDVRARRRGRSARARGIRRLLRHLLAPPRGRPASSGRRRRRRRARARRRVRPRVRVLLRPYSGRRRQQPGRADLLRRRHPAHPARPGAGQPDGGARRAGPPARARGRARRRGPLVLLQPGLRPDRDPAGGVEPAARRRRRRLDDHPAVRQEHPRRRRGDAVAQVPGDGRRGQDLPAAQQGRDPRRLPQRHLLRAGRLRHPGGGARLLRQAGDRSHRGRGGAARRADPVAVAVGPRDRPGQGRAAVELRPRRHGRAGLAPPRRARRGWCSRRRCRAGRRPGACPPTPGGTS